MAVQMPVSPDFELIATAYATLSQEFSRFGNPPMLREGNPPTLHEGNPPTLQEGNQILEELRALQKQVAALQTLITAINENTIARLHNNSISKPDQILMPLHSAFLRGPIPSFPETLNDFNNLPLHVIAKTLWALGTHTVGDPAALKHRLKLQCGLKDESS